MKIITEKQKAEVLHFFFEMKKEKIKTEQNLSFAETTIEKEQCLNYLKKINKALKTLKNYL